MRILAVSDAHGRFAAVEQAIENVKPDIFVFLGDGIGPVEDLRYMYSDINFYFVRGNCDYSDDYPAVGNIKVCGKKVMLTHGHLYNVKSSYEKIKATAKGCGADVLLFGHTHTPYENYEDGLYMMNPGSITLPNLTKPSYGTVDISEKGILTNIVYI